MPRPKSEFPEQVFTRFPAGTRRRLATIAAREGTNTAALIRRYVLQSLGREPVVKPS